MTADHLQEWFEAGACDGYWVSLDINEDEIDTFVGEVIPILQARPVSALRISLSCSELASARDRHPHAPARMESISTASSASPVSSRHRMEGSVAATRHTPAPEPSGRSQWPRMTASALPAHVQCDKQTAQYPMWGSKRATKGSADAGVASHAP